MVVNVSGLLLTHFHTMSSMTEQPFVLLSADHKVTFQEVFIKTVGAVKSPSVAQSSKQIFDFGLFSDRCSESSIDLHEIEVEGGINIILYSLHCLEAFELTGFNFRF